MMLPDFLTLYDESTKKLTGIPFCLDLPKKKKLNLVKLSEFIEKGVTEEEIDLKEQFDDLENIIIPDIFIKEGKVKLRNIIDKVQIHEDTLLGNITVDNLVYLYYRDKIIVVVQTSRHKFQIIQNSKGDRYFIIFFCPRTKYKRCYHFLKNILIKFGLSLSPCILNPKQIEEIRTEVSGDLLDTTLINFPSTTIDKKRIMGKGFQTDPEYLKDAKIGSVHQHMFDFKPVYSEVPFVVTVSGDGLIRFYNKINYDTFFYFIRNHVLDKLRRSVDTAAPLIGFFMEDLFEEEDEV